MDAHRHPDPQEGLQRGSQQGTRQASAPPLNSYPHAYPHPSKEEVRAYMTRRGQTRQPPPAPAEIRRQLGWHAAGHGPTTLVPSCAACPAPRPPAFTPLMPAFLAELAASRYSHGAPSCCKPLARTCCQKKMIR